MENTNKKIDQLLQLRQDGIINFARATFELIEMGVKVENQGTGNIRLPSSFTNFLQKYERSMLEFEWEAEYFDGTKIQQFGEEEHHFGHIDQNKLKSFSLISNFEWPTPNEEKRVIVTLDFQKGEFIFQNGFISQDDRGKLFNKQLPGPKQLIFFARKRMSSSQGSIHPAYQEFVPSLEENFYYNRFIVGFKSESGEKVMLMVYPTGTITFFEE